MDLIVLISGASRTSLTEASIWRGLLNGLLLAFFDDTTVSTTVGGTISLHESLEHTTVSCAIFNQAGIYILDNPICTMKNHLLFVQS